jgi:hypothetical protein
MASAQAQPVATIACGNIAGLDAAITAADAGTGPSTIVLATGCVYTLTTAAVTGTLGPDGLPRITNIVTLVGHQTTIQRLTTASDFRIAEVDGGGTLTVTGITVRDGSADLGGCYLATHGGTLILRNSVVADCGASEGGGIYIGGGDDVINKLSAGTVRSDGIVTTAEIDNSSLSGNSADEGGAMFIASGGTVKLVTDYLAGNEAILGGAIYAHGLGLFVGASDLTRNSAIQGGGIYNDASAQMEIAGSKLELNSAITKGGAISNYGASLLQNSEVESNTAPQGGGIWQGGGTTVAVITQITGNLANNCRPLASIPGCVN